MVAQRLEFLSALEAMLFDPDLKKNFKERSQLHKILEENTWLFGEQIRTNVERPIPHRSLGQTSEEYRR
jgi:hypothetical protein